jgi:polysaccharide export outer membrane protein
MKSILFVIRQFLFLIILATICSSCGFYQYTILFKEDENFNNEAFKKASVLAEQAEKNYMVRKFDFIGIEIFTNKGELLTDPNMEIQMGNRQVDATQQPLINPAIAGQAGAQGGVGIIGNFNSIRRYMVQDDGNAYLPVLGATKLDGLKLYQVDSLLSKQYEKYYKESYVVSRLLNRRTVVIGALGTRVVPLDNDNMSIIEVIASSGFSFDQRLRGDRVRIIRNVLTKPVMQIIDLSTFQGIQAANLKVEPNDIIYLEPRRRVGRDETINDILRTVSPILGIISTTLLTIITLQRL